MNKAEALNARNTRGAVEKQGTYHETTIYEDTPRNKKTRTIYKHTQATDNEGQVKTIKAGQTKTQVD